MLNKPDGKRPIDIETIAAEIKILNMIFHRLIDSGLENQAWRSLGTKNATALGVISIINYFPGITLHALSKKMMMNRSAIASLVVVLIKKGLVTKSDTPSDRRCHSLALTRLGHDVLGQIPLASRDEVLVQNLANFKRKDLECYLAFTRRIIAAMIGQAPVERIPKMIESNHQLGRESEQNDLSVGENSIP